MTGHMRSTPTRPPTRTPVPPGTMVAKSVAGVALIALFAWIGMSGARDDAAPGPSQASTDRPVVITADRAAAHRRQVFEERRARFDGQGPTQLVDAPQYP